MDSALSSPSPGTGASTGNMYLSGENQTLVKLLVAGPFGVGKTTLIRALSETPPLHTEEVMTQTGAIVDDLAGCPGEDHHHRRHRLRAADPAGGPGAVPVRHARAETVPPLWQDIARGALGALVLADTRRLADSFEVMDIVEEAGLRYAVAVNTFPDAPQYDVEKLREALDLHPETPLVLCDARDREQSVDALIALVGHVLAHTPEENPNP